MARNTAPVPSTGGDQYDCWDCLARRCPTETVLVCPQCGGELATLSSPHE